MLTKLNFKPGIDRETTNYANGGGWFDSNLIRFRNGFPEKIGGWARVYTSQTALSGACRKMVPWTSLAGVKLTALPTNERFYVDNSSTIIDISPFRRSLTLGTDPIATTDTSSTIVITDVNHGAVVGDIVVLSGATSVAGISIATLNNVMGHTIIEIIDADSYSVVVSGTANATTTGGGSSVVASYLFHKGAAEQISLAGWGSGAWSGAIAASFFQYENNPITTDTTTNTSAGGIARTQITITTATAHGGAVGDWVLMSGMTSVGGVPEYYLKQALQITSVPTATTFTAMSLGTATSSVTGGGSGVSVKIFAASGNFGWGTGPQTTIVNYNSGMWTADNYGEDLIAAPRDVTNAQPLAANSISVTSGDTEVEVTQVSHGFTTGQAVIIAGAPEVGGIPALDINGTHIVTVIDDDTFTFEAATAATSTTVGGGDGMNTILSSIVYWELNTARAISLSSMGDAYAKKYLPYTATEILTSDINRHVIALGTNPFDTTQGVDKMLIRFSDSSDPTNWDASDTTKTSGELRCSAGSYIVTGLQNREEILIWTDTALFTMNYVGAPYTYGLQLVGSGFDIIGPNAKAVAGAVAYWMGLNNFYSYNGSVAPLPCDVRDFVFSDINRNVGFNVYCSTDSGNNEIIWFYPSANSNENNRYVVYNYADNIWYYGAMARTAWMDRGPNPVPRSVCDCGYLFNQETGTDDGANPNAPAPLNAYIQSSPVEIGDGDAYMFVSRILPDLTFRNTSLAISPPPVVKFTLKTQDFPGAQIYAGDTRNVTRGQQATLMVNRFTHQVYTRLRARSVVLRVESDQLGVAWRLGTPRMDIRQDGRK